MDRCLCTCDRMPNVKLRSGLYRVVCPNCQREGPEKKSAYLAELAWKDKIENTIKEWDNKNEKKTT